MYRALLVRAFRLFCPDGLGAFLAESLARDLPPSSRLLNPSDTKVTFGIQMPTNPAEACELIFLDSKNASMLATLTIVPLSGSERRVTEPLAPKEGESPFSYFSSLFQGILSTDNCPLLSPPTLRRLHLVGYT